MNSNLAAFFPTREILFHTEVITVLVEMCHSVCYKTFIFEIFRIFILIRITDENKREKKKLD